MKFQYYTDNVRKNKLIGTVALPKLIKAIKNPNPKMKAIYDEIHECEINGDAKRKAELKQHLYYFIVPTLSDGKGRAYKNIISFTGALHLDFDHIEEPEKFRDYLFNAYDFIIATWMSASKKGVKALVSIPISKDTDEYKKYFWGLANKHMIKYKGFDKAPQNAVLPLFISYDPDIKYRTDYLEWDQKGENPSTKDFGTTVPYGFKLTISEKYTKAIVSNTEKAINNITDNGHPQVRGAAVALGGQVGAGYISQSDAFNLISSLIRANEYLSKGTKGYLKTAEEMINKGISRPLYFNF